MTALRRLHNATFLSLFCEKDPALFSVPYGRDVTKHSTKFPTISRPDWKRKEPLVVTLEMSELDGISQLNPILSRNRFSVPTPISDIKREHTFMSKSVFLLPAHLSRCSNESRHACVLTVQWTAAKAGDLTNLPGPLSCSSRWNIVARGASELCCGPIWLIGARLQNKT